MGKTSLKTKLAASTETRGARVVLGLLALVLAYLFGRWALDSGSLLDYAITLTLLIFALRELAIVAFKIQTGDKPTKHD